jgi:16S rRNA processing protein RimM
MGSSPSVWPQQKDAGSPDGREPVFLVVGLLRRSHGLHGDVIMDVYTDFPERMRPGKIVLLGENHQPVVVRNIRTKGKELIIGFEGINTPEETTRLRNQKIYIAAKDLPELPAGEYYHHQLIGLRVVDEENHEVGILEDILETGANDVYVVKTASGGELLIPAVEAYILEIDLDQNLMKVAPPIWE